VAKWASEGRLYYNSLPPKNKHYSALEIKILLNVSELRLRINIISLNFVLANIITMNIIKTKNLP
jgi:hypothetical protein